MSRGDGQRRKNEQAPASHRDQPKRRRAFGGGRRRVVIGITGAHFVSPSSRRLLRWKNGAGVDRRRIGATFSSCRSFETPPAPSCRTPTRRSRTRRRAPLAGLTFAVKDLFDVAGYPTSGGQPFVLAMSGIKTTTAARPCSAWLARRRSIRRQRRSPTSWRSR
jgi:hypothetical protein